MNSQPAPAPARQPPAPAPAPDHKPSPWRFGTQPLNTEPIELPKLVPAGRPKNAASITTQLSWLAKEVAAFAEKCKNAGEQESLIARKADKYVKMMMTSLDAFSWPGGRPLKVLGEGLDTRKARMYAPRGLKNKAINCCYFNAVLQSLLPCSAFAMLISNAGPVGDAEEQEKTAPHFLEMYTLFKQFYASRSTTPVDATSCCPSILHQWGRDKLAFDQEDAHEMLLWLLNSLHEECSWKRSWSVGEEEDSPIVRLFGGRTKSIIQKKGVDSGSNFEDFRILDLPIFDGINSVAAALQEFSSSFSYEGEDDPDMTVRWVLDRLPSFLVIALKRFRYNREKERIDKDESPILVDETLTVNAALQTPADSVTNADVVYKLRSVVCHFGDSGASGHYNVFARHSADVWHVFDDEHVSRKTTSDLAAQSLQKTAYILIYESTDQTPISLRP
jgi:ubiquitin C-terminal hydrolase